MDITEIRRENLRRWVVEHGTPAKEKSLFSQLKSNGSFGEKVARRLEDQYKMGSLYLDNGGEIPFAKPPERRQAIRDEVEDAPAITGQLKAIPIVGRVQAGPDGTISIDDYGHNDGYMFWYASSPDAYALRIRGESMSPRYLPGEIVGVDPSVEVQSNDEAIVMLRDGRRMIKRLLWRRDGQACFESVNKDFPNIILDVEEIDKMHLVSGHIPKAAFRSE